MPRTTPDVKEKISSKNFWRRKIPLLVESAKLTRSSWGLFSINHGLLSINQDMATLQGLDQH